MIVYTDKLRTSITLYPFIFLLKKKRGNKVTINHEKIHIEQQKEMLVVFFYIWYVVEWFIRLFMKGNAYKNISFEREAYSNDNNLSYLKTRKRYSFLKYYKK